MNSFVEEISWDFEVGRKEGYDYMLYVEDSFDYNYYPVYTNKVDFHKVFKAYHRVNMQKVIEIYDLAKHKDEQLSAHRVWNPPAE